MPRYFCAQVYPQYTLAYFNQEDNGNRMVET